MTDLVRHGDMLFKRVPERPDSSAGRTQTTKSRTVIQEGEVTGHAHRITEGEAAILDYYERRWSTDNDPPRSARFLEVATPTTISHEEHKPVVLAPGLYEILQAREFDYAANLGRRVRD